MRKSNPKTHIGTYSRNAYTYKAKMTTNMKPEDKKEIEAIERELHQDGQQVRTAIDPSKNYK